MSDEDYALLELGVKNLKNQLAYHKQRLERVEYVVLVSGWLVKKIQKAHNYVEVEARACVVTWVSCQLLHSLSGRLSATGLRH